MSGKPTPTTYETGNGELLCGACAQPLAFHEGFGPCPWWDAGLVADRDNLIKQASKGYKEPKLRSMRERNQ